MTPLVALLLAALPWLEGGASATGLFVAQTLIFALAGMALVRACNHSGGAVISCGWEAVAGLGMLACAFISFVRVDYWFGSFLSLWELLVAALLALALIVSRTDRSRMDRAWSVWTHLVALASASQAIAVWAMPARPNLTPSGSFANANQLSAYLCMGALVAAGLGIERARSRSGPGRWAAIALIGVAALDVATVLRVGSRGAIAALLVVSTVWLALAVPPSRRQLRLTLAACLVLLAIGGAWTVMSRFQRMQDPYLYDRVEIWRASLRAAADHPLLGMGPGMFARRAYPYNFPLEREMFRFSKSLTSPHSTYLRVLAETGLVGLAATGITIVLLMMRLWRARGHPAVAGSAMALMVCLLHGAVDTPFEVPAITLTLVALLVPQLTPEGSARAAIHMSLPLALPAGAGPSARRSGRRRAVALFAALALAYAGCVLVPYAAHACYLHGLTQSRQGSPAPGLSRAIALNPLNPLYPATRADRSWRRDRRLTPATLARAHLDLEAAHRLDPADPDHLVALAQLHARACFELDSGPACVARAEGLYREAIALGRKDPRPHLELAVLLLAFGRREEGMAQIDEALRLEPRYLAAHFARVRASLESERKEEARLAMGSLQRTLDELASYEPRNGYEADLMKLDQGMLAQVREQLR